MAKIRLSDIFVIIMLLAITAGLAAFPAGSVSAAAGALSVCLTTVIPSLFSFFVVSNLIISLGYAGYFGRAFSYVMGPVFHLGGQCGAVFALGLLGGYPVGARSAAALYKSGSCTKKEAEHMLTFCNNCGPAFILGVAGAGVFGSSRAGTLLYLTHVFSALAVGLIFRGKRSHEAEISSTKDAMSLPSAFVSSVKGAVTSTLNVTGFIIFFSVLIFLMNQTGIISVISRGSVWAQRILTGIFEVSGGVMSLKGTTGTAPVVAAAFMLGWGGLCVHLQTLSELEGSGLSVKNYFIGKALQGLTAAALTSIIVSFTDISAAPADLEKAAFSRPFHFPPPVTAAMALLYAFASERILKIFGQKSTRA